MDSVGVIGRGIDEVGEPIVVHWGISSRSVVESFSALADDDGDNWPTEDIGERRIWILITGLLYWERNDVDGVSVDATGNPSSSLSNRRWWDRVGSLVEIALLVPLVSGWLSSSSEPPLNSVPWLSDDILFSSPSSLNQFSSSASRSRSSFRRRWDWWMCWIGNKWLLFRLSCKREVPIGELN